MTASDDDCVPLRRSKAPSTSTLAARTPTSSGSQTTSRHAPTGFLCAVRRISYAPPPTQCPVLND
eukprot:3387053-Rhodomonas_salina.3